MYATPAMSCLKKYRASSSEKRPLLQMRSNNSPPARRCEKRALVAHRCRRNAPEAYSMTMARCEGVNTSW